MHFRSWFRPMKEKEYEKKREFGGCSESFFSWLIVGETFALSICSISAPCGGSLLISIDAGTEKLGDHNSFECINSPEIGEF